MKKKRWRDLSLRSRLMLYFVLLIVVPLTALSVIVNLQVSDLLESDQVKEADHALLTVKDSLDAMTAEGEASLAWLATRESLTKTGTETERKALLRDLESFIKTHPDTVEAYVGTADGKFIIYPQAQIPDGYDPRPRPWYELAAKSPGTMQWSSPFQTKNGHHVISLSTTLKDAKGQVTGVVAIEFELQQISEMIKKTEFGTEGYAMLLDDARNIIAYPPDESLLGKPMEAGPAIDRLYDSNQPTSGRFYEEDGGREKLMIYQVLENTGWRLSGTLYTDEVQSTLGGIQKTMLIVGVIALAVAVGVAYLVAVSVTKYLGQLEELMHRAEQGDLSVHSENDAGDEVGRVSRSFNQMLVGMRELLTEVAMTSSQLAASSDQLMVSADQTAQASEHIARSVEQIATGSQEQTTRITETSHVIGELTVGVQQISSNVQDVSARATVSAQQAESGRTFMQEAIHTMDEVYNRVSETAESVGVLGTKSQEIGEIVDLITQIAGQTNLLALNAAIEAARAGEAGRGFAVVADEVRKLAEQSASAAQQITDRIHEIQLVTDTVVTQVQDGMDGMKRGHGVFQQAGGVFAQIIDEVQTITSQVQSVSAASEQMAVGTGQMVGSVDRIVEIAEGFASQSQEVNAAVEEQTASMEEVHMSAQQLSDMATKLQDLVYKFQL
ncbi:methyl-accepting chemotaxis protein [Tumebacillus sp. DT12]|uniref:Methyl-accepting chemotaxis protein n=1 Tax=Tumebacillus lacus TaxID=2995335 RepID=A0ABT3X114_9BACL|nr:methyl-accepting chemotaxis protein [Tumebacillus lacus]MCX7569667.1 methyl-accepting chemotaxis protein [Tumebacillus lacus]